MTSVALIEAQTDAAVAAQDAARRAADVQLPPTLRRSQPDNDTNRDARARP
jgi:hypothetical protein